MGIVTIISIISSLSNSGLSLINEGNNLSLYFLLIACIGGSVISNSSGIKLVRFYILTKTTGAEIIKLISPNSVVNRNMYATGKKLPTII